MKKRVFLPTVLLSMALLGCQQQTPSSNVPSASTKLPADASIESLCDRFPASEMSTLLGYPVEIQDEYTLTTETIISCSYNNSETGNGVSMSLTFGIPGAMTVQKLYDDGVAYEKENLASSSSIKEVPELANLGQESFGTSARYATSVIVNTGNAVLNMSVTGDEQDQTIQTAKTVAEHIVSKL